MDLHLRLLAFARTKARLSKFFMLEIFRQIWNNSLAHHYAMQLPKTYYNSFGVHIRQF